jgi:hypothetical protein
LKAISTKGLESQKCISIPLPSDGRIQVAGRKGLPHVIYARLWRWPKINKKDLKRLDICKAFSKSANSCVNPYHYQPITSPYLNNAEFTLAPRQSSQPRQSSFKTIII